MEDAFDVKAFHYLIKPINESKFNAVFSRAVSDCHKNKSNFENYIIIKDGDTYCKIHTKDIFYVESQNKKAIINSANGILNYYGTMQEIENILGNRFFRCHRCYIVNMDYVVRYNSNTIWIKNGDKILLAQKKYGEFVKAFMMYTRSGGNINGING